MKECVGGLAPLAPENPPVAEHVLLGEDRDIRRRETVLEWEHEERRLRLAAQCFLPGIGELVRLQPMVFEQPEQALARAFGVARGHDLVAASAQFRDMACYRLIDIRLLGAL